MAPLHDGTRFRLLAPSRVRVFHDGDWYDDIEKTEKAKTEKEKSGKKN
jgi:hypothetical protein